MTPEKKRQRIAEQEERLREAKEQRRRELEAAIASKDVSAMASIARDTIQRMCRETQGMRWLDIDDLRRLAPALAVEAEVRGRPRQYLSLLSTALQVKGDLSGYNVEGRLSNLLIGATHEITELLVNIEVRARAVAAPAAPVAPAPAQGVDAGKNASTNAKNEPQECIVERMSPKTATVREGGTVVTIGGSRRTWLLLQVVEARRRLTWKELAEADMKKAGEIMDRRATAGSSKREIVTPKLAINPESLQNLGTRIRRDLGKLSYHWHQDGQGVVWSRDCQ
jgi:hypothetical protein